MKRLLSLTVLLVLFAVSCGRSEEIPEDTDSYPDYSRVSLRSSVTSVQPMTGIVMWSDKGSEHKQDFQLEFSYMLYSDVCKEKDVYDWSVVDNLLKKIAANGHQAVLRFRYTYPGKQCAVPAYIKALPDYEETVGKADGGTKTWFPDWRNAELQRFHMEFYKLFAERYDKDPRIAFLETGFGLWAEYHIYDGPFISGQTFPSKDFQAEFLSNMDTWFTRTPWMISIDAADKKYGPFRMKRELLDLKFGNFDDSFMCEDHDSYNLDSWYFFGRERFKTAPGGGEFSYYSNFDQKHCLDTAGMYGRHFESEVAKFHLSFIIGNDQPRYQKWTRIAEASKSMGYRFRITDYRIKEGTGAVVCVENTGVAPIYYDAFIAVDGEKGDANLRNLMPGESVWAKIDNPSVSASSVPVIVCDRLVPGQKIEFDADVSTE